MIKCILAEFYGSDGYKCEIYDAGTFDIKKMDQEWEKYFNKPIREDPDGAWEMTDCEVEPLFEVSVQDDDWCWQIGRRLWFNNHYKLIYDQNGTEESIETALEAALTAFENMIIALPMTDLEDIDDDIV